MAEERSVPAAVVDRSHERTDGVSREYVDSLWRRGLAAASGLRRTVAQCACPGRDSARWTPPVLTEGAECASFAAGGGAFPFPRRLRRDGSSGRRRREDRRLDSTCEMRLHHTDRDEAASDLGDVRAVSSGGASEGAVPQTDLAYVGDRLRFTVPQTAAEASFACTCGGLAAERLYVPRTRLAVRARLVADGGRILKEGFDELDLADVPPGVYRLETVLSDGEEELSPRVFRLTVRPSPWVTVGEKGTDHFGKPGCLRVENAIIGPAEGEVLFLKG